MKTRDRKRRAASAPVLRPAAPAPAPEPTSSSAAAAKRSPWTLLRWALFLGTLGLAIVGRVRYFDWCLHDDAFISFRYARNLVRGHGLVMNPGEHVEGITNFFWTLLAAPAIALGIDPAWGSQVAGAVISLALMAAAFVYTEKRLGGGWFALVTPVFLAFNLSFVMESLSGLETVLFAALVFAAWVLFLEERRDGTRRPGGWAVAAAVATLVRPEGGMLFAVLGAWAVLGVLRGEPRRPLGTALLVYAVLVLPLFVWRLVEYGALLPNTFYAKVGYTSAQVARGWRYLYYSVGYAITGPVIAVAAFAAVMALARRIPAPGVPSPRASWTKLYSGRPRDEALLTCAILCGVWLVYLAIVGGDYEPTARFYMPVLVPLWILFQEGLRTLTLLVAGGGRTVQAAITAVVLALGTVCLARSEQRFLTLLQERSWPQARKNHHDELRAVGTWLGQNTAPGTVIAVSSIGALPYYADRPVIDMMGLTDRHIGRRHMASMGKGAAGHEKGDGEYVLSRQPDVILLDKGHLFPQEMPPEKVLEGARGVSERELIFSTEFTHGYELRRTRTSFGVLHVFVKRPQ